MTDLEWLWKVHEDIAYNRYRPRRSGYTYYTCHILCGSLEVLENETILVMLLNHQRIYHWTHALIPVLEEHDIIIDKIVNQGQLILFKNNTNKVKFITPKQSFDTDIMYDRIRGIAPDTYMIQDLD